MQRFTEEQTSYLLARGIPMDVAGDLYGREGDDLLIPYLDPNRKPLLIASEAKDADGKLYIVRRPFPAGTPKFETPMAAGNRPYFSRLMPDGYLQDVTKPLVLIEGPIKVDSCWCHIPEGFCFVGLSGVWNWKDRRNELGVWTSKQEKTRTLPELKSIPLKNRKVVILFDSDAVDNPAVGDASRAIANWARKQGAAPRMCELPSEDNGQKNGADDYLVRHGATALRERIQQAEDIGWNLPGALLKENGELRGDYTPRELDRVLEFACSLPEWDRDILLAKVAAFNRLRKSDLERRVEQLLYPAEKSGVVELEDLLSESDDAPIIPGMLDQGGSLVASGNAGASKSLLFCYELLHTLVTGSQFLGTKLHKRKVLLVQAEEPDNVMRERLKAKGMLSGELREQFNKTWGLMNCLDTGSRDSMTEFEQKLAQLKPDLVIIDSLREITTGQEVDMNRDIGRKAVRPLRQRLKQQGIALVLVHHSTGTSKHGGDKDILAAVDCAVHIGLPDGADPEKPCDERVVTNQKNRTNSSFTLHLSINRCPGAHQHADADEPTGWEWKLTRVGQDIDDSLSIKGKAMEVLYQSLKPLTLREIADTLGLANDGSKVNKSLRNIAGNPLYGLSQWKQGKEFPASYFVPLADRPSGHQQQIRFRLSGDQTALEALSKGYSHIPLLTTTTTTGPCSHTNRSAIPNTVQTGTETRTQHGPAPIAERVPTGSTNMGGVSPFQPVENSAGLSRLKIEPQARSSPQASQPVDLSTAAQSLANAFDGVICNELEQNHADTA